MVSPSPRSLRAMPASSASWLIRLPSSRAARPVPPRASPPEEGTSGKVEVGSKEYARGLFDMDMEKQARLAEGRDMMPATIKFVGRGAVVLVGLTYAFLASNGVVWPFNH